MKMQCDKVIELIKKGVLEPPMDGNHGEKHPKTDDYVSIGVPFILVPDLKDGIVDLDNCNFISEEQAKNLKKGFSKTGDVLFTHKATIGKVALVDTKQYNYIILTPQVTYYRVKNDNILSNRYLYYYFLSPTFQKIFRAFASSGGTRDYLGIEAQRKLPIFYPEIHTQERIADILSQYDNLMHNNNKRIKILEQMAENLYKEWFVRFRFPCRSKIILQKRSPRGWVISSKATDMVCPGNWEYGSFSRLGKFVRGKNITADKMIEGNIPVVSAGLEPSGYHNVHNVTGKSLTISASGANAGYLKYHLSDIWAADCSYFQDGSKLWFVYNALKFLQPVISNLQIGAAQPHVYPKSINKLCTVIPDDDTMHMYCEKVEPIYEQIQRLKEENQNLIKQRDMLLPRLMSGKLEVK